MILPPPAAPFEWRSTPHGPALFCPPLEPIAHHLFTSRAWRLGEPNAPPDAWTDLASSVNVASSALVRLRQVHGRTMVNADIGRPSTDVLPEGDLVVASDPAVALTVRVADCVPLLLADRQRRVVLAAHAGWRGLAQGVPRAAVDALATVHGSRPADLVAAIGPSIGSCCYEVGEDVAQAFSDQGCERQGLAGWFHSAPTPTPHNRSMPGLPERPRANHWYFDGWACARDQLLAAGLRDEAIFTAGLCTASHANVFCSYRREGRRAGRLAAVIRIRTA
jgi:YfiH family protein